MPFEIAAAFFISIVSSAPVKSALKLPTDADVIFNLLVSRQRCNPLMQYLTDLSTPANGQKSVVCVS